LSGQLDNLALESLEEKTLVFSIQLFYFQWYSKQALAWLPYDTRIYKNYYSKQGVIKGKMYLVYVACCDECVICCVVICACEWRMNVTTKLANERLRLLVMSWWIDHKQPNLFLDTVGLSVTTENAILSLVKPIDNHQSHFFHLFSFSDLTHYFLFKEFGVKTILTDGKLFF
jgi:hypothetical protein